MNSELHEFSIIIYNFSKYFLKKYGFAPFMFTPFVGKHVVSIANGLFLTKEISLNVWLKNALNLTHLSWVSLSQKLSLS